MNRIIRLSYNTIIFCSIYLFFRIILSFLSFQYIRISIFYLHEIIVLIFTCIIFLLIKIINKK